MFEQLQQLWYQHSEPIAAQHGTSWEVAIQFCNIQSTFLKKGSEAYEITILSVAQ
jgi:hypothetical protein